MTLASATVSGCANYRLELVDSEPLGDVYQVVKGLERKIEAGAVAVAQGDVSPDEWDEPADVAAALDALADL